MRYFENRQAEINSVCRLNLIDEYRFLSLPVILGEGKPYFTKLDKTLDLTLLETRQFESGAVLHRYEPKPESENEKRDRTK